MSRRETRKPGPSPPATSSRCPGGGTAEVRLDGGKPGLSDAFRGYLKWKENEKRYDESELAEDEAIAV